MAWIEKTGPDRWRVRWRRADGTTGSVTRFRSKTAASNYTDEMECEQRRGTWLDPSGFRTTLDIKLWTKEAAEDGYAPTTIASWVNLLSMIFTDAVDQRLIATNPIHKRRRRGRRSRRITPEKTWATPEHVLRIADQAGMLGGPTARLLIITAAWTGCRWGELTGCTAITSTSSAE